MNGYENPKILGRNVDFDSIHNPVLKRVLKERLGKNFLFAYSDDDGREGHTEHTEGIKKDSPKYEEEYNDHKEYGDHNEHSEHTEKYKDYYEHQEHADYDKYADNYSEYWELEKHHDSKY